MKDYNTKNLWSTFKNLPEKERKDLTWLIQ